MPTRTFYALIPVDVIIIRIPAHLLGGFCCSEAGELIVFEDWEDPFVIVHLDWDDQAMRRAVLALPRERDKRGKLRIFNSYSRVHLQERLDKTLQLMDVMGFASEASEIDKIVGETPDPVWRVVISYRYEPYHFAPT